MAMQASRQAGSNYTRPGSEYCRKVLHA